MPNTVPFMQAINGSKEVHSWIKGVGFVTPNHRLGMFARSDASPDRKGGYLKRAAVDGKPLELSVGDRFVTADGELSVEYVAGGARDGDDLIDLYVVTVRDTVKMQVKMRPEVPVMRIPTDSWIHFSLEVLDEQLSTRAHGILGQTLYNLHNPEAAPAGYSVEYSGVVWAWQVVGADGDNYIQGKPADYATTNVLTTDCRFSRFSRRGLLHSALSLGCWRSGFVC